MKFISVEEKAGQYMVTVEESWFGYFPKIVRYFGDCTVFHRLPNFERVGTAKEIVLYQFLAKWKYENSGEAT